MFVVDKRGRGIYTHHTGAMQHYNVHPTPTIHTPRGGGPCNIIMFSSPKQYIHRTEGPMQHHNVHLTQTIHTPRGGGPCNIIIFTSPKQYTHRAEGPMQHHNVHLIPTNLRFVIDASTPHLIKFQTDRCTITRLIFDLNFIYLFISSNTHTYSTIVDGQ